MERTSRNQIDECIFVVILCSELHRNLDGEMYVQSVQFLPEIFKALAISKY